MKKITVNVKKFDNNEMVDILSMMKEGPAKCVSELSKMSNLSRFDAIEKLDSVSTTTEWSIKKHKLEDKLVDYIKAVDAYMMRTIADAKINSRFLHELIYPLFDSNREAYLLIENYISTVCKAC